MTKPSYQETIDGMADEFRDDAIARLTSITEILAGFQHVDNDIEDDFSKISRQVHSIKGTARTFGFHGLSYIACALYAWLQDIEKGKSDAVSLQDRALGKDLEIFTALMLNITEAKDRQVEQQGVDALDDAEFTLYRLPSH